MSELSPPTLALLDIELNEITDWERLSVHINLGWKYEEVLRKVGHLGIDRCKLKLFRIWIKTGTNVTWRAIADALGKMDENTLAEKIRKKYEPVIDEQGKFPENRTQQTVSVSKRIQKYFANLQSKFSELISQLKKSLLRCKPDELDDIFDYMQSVIPSQQLASWPHDDDEFPNYLHLELKKHCDYLHFSLIENIATVHLINDPILKKVLKRYKRKLKKFKTSREISTLITTVHQYICDKGMKLVRMKFQHYLEAVRIEVFIELLKQVFFEEYEIPAKMKVIEGCLSIQWYASISSCNKLTESLTADNKHQFLEAIGIIYIEIGGKTIYRTKKSYDYDTEDISFAFSNAVSCQNIEGCEFLLHAFCNTILANESHFPSIFSLPEEPTNIMEIACYHGHVQVVSTLLQFGQYRERLNSTPLMIASGRGHSAVVKLLLESSVKININKQGPDGETALHLSCQHHKTDVARFLLRHCQQTNIDLDIADNNDMTPLMISVGSNKVALAHQLLESGANPNIAKKDGDTALHIACYYGHVKMVRQLLKFNADPCALKADGWMPLMVAIPSNHVKVVKILLKQGKVDPNMQNKNDGDNPLLIASWNNCTDIVRVLLSNGADPNITKHDGWTPLIAASLLGHLSIVEELFQKGAFINTQAKDGVTPIYVASQDGHAMVVRFLLDKGADFYLTKTDSETSITTSPLVIACQNGHSDIVELLLEKDIKQINARNPESGATPLFIASYHSQAAVVKLLLMRGANPFIKDKNKQTPIDVSPCKLCKEILREAGAIETKQTLPQRVISNAKLQYVNAKNFTTRLVGNLRRRFIRSST